MNRKKILSVLSVFLLTVLIVLAAYKEQNNMGQIYLYGEAHGVKEILDEEFELWNKYYHEEGMRHLFIEEPYYGAEFKNLWMQSENDEILDELYMEMRGTASGTLVCKIFFKRIKEECPETIFHGIDVGHLYATTGERYLSCLREQNLEDSENYRFALNNIKQGKHYYDNEDDVYRENRLAQNFQREFDKLKGENIMGIFGSAHTVLGQRDYKTGTVLNMASQLEQVYSDKISSEDLSVNYNPNEPLSEDILEINGKQYKADNYGELLFPIEVESYSGMHVWKLKEGQEDFKEMPLGEISIDSVIYPMEIQYGQVYVLDMIKLDGSMDRKVFRSDGKSQEDGTILTREILFE